MRSFVLGVTIAISHVAYARPARPVTVYLERDGEVLDDGRTIPRFGGGTRVWNEVVACVKEHYAPFRVEVVDRQPTRSDYITAVIGGRAAQLGLADTVDGDSPYAAKVMRNAVVHVFSKSGHGERDVTRLCETTAHEVGHALGLDHVLACDDLMSPSKRCGTPTFVDADKACGEHHARTCDNGDERQNSYRRLAALVGLRADDGDSPREVTARGHHRRHRRRS